MTIEKTNLMIAGRVTARQVELDVAATEAAGIFANALRAALVAGVTDPDALLICETVAANVTAARQSDGFPEARLPEGFAAMLGRSVAAGILEQKNHQILLGTVACYPDFSGVADYGDARGAHEAAVTAWMAARDYRRRNAS